MKSTRRKLLLSTPLFAAMKDSSPVLSAAASQDPDPFHYDRCEKLRPRIEDREVPSWEFPLPIPPLAQKLPSLLTNIGELDQGVAPEWKAVHGNEDHELKRILRRDHPEIHYEMWAGQFDTEIIAGKKTRVLGYGTKNPDGQLNYSTPGPLFIVRPFEPMVVRVRNMIDYNKDHTKRPESEQLHVDISVHQHGGHIPAHADGHPNFLVPPGQVRDYYYPNSVPREAHNGQLTGDWDISEMQGTMWYHDHAEDITAHNALMGLGGLFIMHDKEEDKWSRNRVLPKGMWQTVDELKDQNRPVTAENLREELRDIPLVLKDICMCKGKGEKASIHFDPFDHNGSLGNIVCINGMPKPFLKVKRGKYRFRFLNASLARMYNLEFHEGRFTATCPLNTAEQFWQIGRDSWVFDRPRRQSSLFLSMANRADAVVDFSKFKAGTVIYLISTLNQKDGRGPGHGDKDMEVGDRGDQFHLPDLGRNPIKLLKIIVEGDELPEGDDALELTHDTPLREHKEIKLSEAVNLHISSRRDSSGNHKTEYRHQKDHFPRREFIFERRQGAWQITHRFYDPCTQNAVPRRDTTELWILKNKSGGWWHPIHIHLESHQQIFAHARGLGGKRYVVCRHDYRPHKDEWDEDLLVSSEDLAENFDAGRRQHESDTLHRSRACDCPACLANPKSKKGVTTFDSSVWNTGIKHDTTVLGPNTEVHILMQFRTFEGPFVFHCHNLNHEDMRMMYQFDPRKGISSPLTNVKTEPGRWHFFLPNGQRAKCHPLSRSSS